MDNKYSRMYILYPEHHDPVKILEQAIAELGAEPAYILVPEKIWNSIIGKIPDDQKKVFVNGRFY